MDKLLVELINENECVIIPDFGALLLQHRAAYYDKARGIFYPPSYQLLFNRNINISDGILENYLLENNYINSKSIISNWIKHVYETISTDNCYFCKNLGYFYFNTEQKLCFDEENEFNQFGDFTGLKDIKIAKQTINKSIFTLKSRSSMDITEENDKNLNDSKSKSTNKKLLYIVPFVIFCIALSVFFVSRKGTNQAGIISSTKEDTLKKDYNYEDPLGENLNIEKLEKGEKIGKIEKLEKPDIIYVDTEIDGSNNVEEVPNAQENISEKVLHVSASNIVSSSHNRCYIIYAGFATLRKAEKVRKELEDDGFDSKIIQPHGKVRLYRISISDYSTKMEALQKADGLKEKYGDKLWVHIY